MIENKKLPKNLIIDSSTKDKLKVLGQKFNRLTFKSIIGYRQEKDGKRVIYILDCDCGNSCYAIAKDVKQGKIKSCGCYHKETSRQTGLNNANKKLENYIKAENRYYNQYKTAAKLRNKTFTLSKEDFINITKSNCHYCNSKPSKSYGKGTSYYRFQYVCNGIDRKDNDLGYTLENSLPCCYTCNRAKHISSYDEFIEWINKLKNNNI